ncbi:CD109 antigen-like isoform X1 [Anopheles albimanus]|uniref:CD109 antigen n=1 Tax=Anopheles albimanus TaxID=7167 RepID=A0A8W7K8T8_ANOAL|nr:CD109 antigen-like isoform X1 [Anopheles albimanus]
MRPTGRRPGASILWASSLLVLGCCITGSQAAEGHYSVVGAKLLRPNSEYHVSVTNQDVQEPITFRLAIAEDEKVVEQQQITLNTGETRLVPFTIGDIPDGSYKLVAEGLSGLTFKNETNLQYQQKSFSVFVQTDKSIYKPGDTVRFRVLVLDPNTKPLAKASSIEVYINDGKGNRIKQWKNGTLVKGVFESMLTLSAAPVLGAWSINLDVLGTKHTKTFEVDEYVLPKFEVTIESPGITTFKDGKVKIIVRSKYTYGKPVKGEATVSVMPEFRFHYVQPDAKGVVTRKVIPIDGKGSVEFDLREEVQLQGDYARNIVFEAVVEEELTGRKQNATTKVMIYDRRYKMELVKSDDNYKPGLPYTAWLKVSHQDDSPVQDQTNPVEVQQSTYMGQPIKTNYTLDGNGMAKLVIDTDVNGSFINLQAYYLGQEFYLNGISKADSDVDSYIRARVVTELPTVNEDVVVEVAATVPMKSFTYQLLGRGDVLLSNTVAVPETKIHTFKFRASFAMVPRAKLVVFYIAANGDMVSDSKVITFDSELPNFMKVTLSKEQTKPGQDVEITVSTNPDSYVGLLGVDQSVLLLKSGNDITKDQVFSELEKYEERSYAFYRRKKRYVWRSYGEHRDFESVGAFVLSNANDPPPNNTLPEAPIYKFHRAPNGTVLYTSIEKQPRAQPKQVLITNTRPPLAGPFAFSRLPRPHRDIPRLFLSQEIQNTWLFDNTYSGFSGEKTLQKKVPDTITSWIITGFSVNPVYGLGLTQRPRKLNVFLPFFVSTNLPYSVKRGEVVAIPIVVFNYMADDLTATVVLENNEQEFEFADVENEIIDTSKVELSREKRLAVPANSGKSVSFMVKPKKLGHITIKVQATSDVAGDAVERQLLVEPEGLPQYVNKAMFLDLRATPEVTKTFELEIPRNAVPDSTRIEVAVIGDVLGSTIQNLDSLIRMPYGCGEQNMLNFVPNIVVLDYLKATNKLTANIEGKAKKFMEAGYQRELSYKHKDGSFSAFGENDKSGSTWLTAFVARSFKQAASHITVDESVIDKSLEWLSDHQAPNGSFPEVGVVSHKDMQGGSGSGVALTAYTLIAFLENYNLVNKYKNTINKAIDYVYRNTESLDDTYALALAAYALQLADHSSKAVILAKLDAKASTDSDTKWWHKPIPEADAKNPWYGRPNSVNVEMSAYGMLTFIEAGLDTDALPIMKWLIGQRNDKGGFQSTQDTVVGLQALAKLAAKISSSNNDVTIAVNYATDMEKRMSVNTENGMILQKFELPSATRNIELKATGSGFAVVQLSYKYNMNVTGEWPRFVLDPQVNANTNPDHLHLSVCTSFVPSGGQNVSNMAVMEVSFPSGFTADSDTLPSLENTPYIKKVETKDGDTTVVLYFDSLDQRELCPTVSAFRTHKVAKQKPAPVVIYDYYDNSRIARQFYDGPKASLCDICEQEDCSDACSIKSQKQRSPAEQNATTTWGNMIVNGGQKFNVSFLTVLLSSVVLRMVQ